MDREEWVVEAQREMKGEVKECVSGVRRGACEWRMRSFAGRDEGGK